jgi:hypothetical protein
MNKRAAISRFVSPRATSSATSRSRRVSADMPPVIGSIASAGMAQKDGRENRYLKPVPDSVLLQMTTRSNAA